MLRTVRRGWPGIRVTRVVWPLLLLVLVTGVAVPAAASRPAEVIVLPGATSAEGIAAGRGATFYAGDLFAGGFTGQAYVYDLATGATVASYQFATPPATVINDVAITKRGAWFTDSAQAQLYFVPVSRAGVPGPSRTLALSGPAADTSGAFNLNGIQATANGKTLIVAHSANGALYSVDPRTGASARIAGVSVPTVDGIVLEGRRLWAVQNTNQVTRIRLGRHLRSGVVDKVITSALFQTPS